MTDPENLTPALASETTPQPSTSDSVQNSFTPRVSDVGSPSQDDKSLTIGDVTEDKDQTPRVQLDHSQSQNEESSLPNQDNVATSSQSAAPQNNTLYTGIPTIKLDGTPPRPSSRWSERRWGVLKPRKSTESMRPKSSNSPSRAEETSFQGITMDIPTTDFRDMTLNTMEFSKRGSLVTGQQSSTPATFHLKPEPEGAPSLRKRTSTSLRVRHSLITPRAVSADEDMLSRRVRLMYEKGEENVTDSELTRAIAEENSILWEEHSPIESATDHLSELNSSTTDLWSTVSAGATNSIKRESKELSGGIEDWQNIDAGDVDRYGFIVPQSKRGELSEPQPLQRVSTSLLLASETPRRKNTFRKSVSNARSSSRSLVSKSPTRDRKLSESSNRPSSSQSAYSPTLKRSPSKFRYATNRLPHNRDRRVRDEAGDMLTLPFEVPETADNDISTATKKKEWEREDKWMKMAKPTKKTNDGSGMTFEFDTNSSKLIERTWKGIPDSWRATAWYAFLEASARKHEGSPSAAELISAFHEYQHISSPDDVQIDIDVPRTISSHIMFRRRYRGGQRLLFRVLHAMSLYFPDTGYVQGMAALTATLLAYYDEENAFVMLARLWMLRGLQHLYREGFSGLMEALGDFEKEWLGNGEVADKLNELGIPPTSYGTRWYLTLFNYSIPFPAQLRVWDVFMLLGDAELPSVKSNGRGNQSSQPHQSPSSFGQGFDVLHAASAALIDGMRDIVLESDFENAMKVLTSWVPIKDIELFMRVARAEFKVHRHRKKHG